MMINNQKKNSVLAISLIAVLSFYFQLGICGEIPHSDSLVNAQSLTFKALNNDIIRYILNTSSIPDVIATMQTCKQWYNLYNSTQYTQKMSCDNASPIDHYILSSPKRVYQLTPADHCLLLIHYAQKKQYRMIEYIISHENTDHTLQRKNIINDMRYPIENTLSTDLDILNNIYYNTRAYTAVPYKSTTQSSAIFYRAIRSNKQLLMFLCLKNGLNFFSNHEYQVLILSVVPNEYVFSQVIPSSVDINMVGDQGKTALHYASRASSAQSVKLLIEKGARVNEKDDHQSTPLYYAVTHNRLDIAQLLLRAGADPLLKSNKQKSPLDIARELKNQPMITLLQSYCVTQKCSIF